MITSVVPSGSTDLEDEVGRILFESGFAVKLRKRIQLARGYKAVDVYAEETVEGRRNRMICECKCWNRPIDLEVVHSFQTVMEGSGANIGYIISAGGFQAGAFEAATHTNIQLRTWQGFQSEFEGSWIENHLRPEITARLDELHAYTAPVLPFEVYNRLTAENAGHFRALKERYDQFGLLVMLFTRYAQAVGKELPPLPLRKLVVEPVPGTIPDAILDAEGYREFMELAITYGEDAILNFRALFPNPDYTGL
jgi:hypothetical protein